MHKALSELGDQYQSLVIEGQPFSASMLGLPGADANVPDVTEAAEEQFTAQYRSLLEEAEALARQELDPVDRVSCGILETLCQQALDENEAKSVEFTSTPFFFGAQAQVLGLVPKARITSGANVEDYLTRVGKLPGFLAGSAERLQQGTKRGRTPVAFGVAGSIAQIDSYLSMPVAEDPIMRTLLAAEGIATEAQHDRLAQLITDELRPAMAAYREVLHNEILSTGRPDERCGVRWLENGDEIYRRAARRHTTTERTPEEFHQLGLEQITRLEEEYLQIAGPVLGTQDLQLIYTRLREDEGLRFVPPDEAVTAAEAAVARATAAVPEWFGRLPGTPCLVKAMPEVEARGHTVAYYQPPGQTGSHGTYWINTFGPVTRRFDAETIAFHEALPGHHLQIALASELDDLPEFRKFAIFTAYAEGWGLYTERLADEMELYSSQLDRIGMLSCDSMRACRLVVDTGLHHLGWSRQQAVDYMVDHSPLSRALVGAEVDRYIVYPGQALGYMVGRLEILRMREEARQAMGPRFDIAGFHDVVIGQGSVPLTVLDDMVREWASA